MTHEPVVKDGALWWRGANGNLYRAGEPGVPIRTTTPADDRPGGLGDGKGALILRIPRSLLEAPDAS